MIGFILLSFFTLAVIGVPVGIVVALTTIFGFYYTDNTIFLSMIAQRMFSGMDSFTFLALPFFLLAGEIMNKVGLTGRLVDFSNLFFGRLKGGLAQVNIVTSIIFGGISGAAVADTAALGSIFIPSMTKQGYGKDFSTAVTVASSIIAPIIPPSIIMVLYGSIMEVSIAGLFAAGIVPGLMIGVALMILTRIIAGRRNYPTNPEKITVTSLAMRTRGAMWALMMPVIILGGILGGIVTPTEAAAVAVGLALFIGLVVYRNLSFSDLYGVFFKSAVTMGVITMLLSAAKVLAWFLAIQQVPEMVAQMFMAMSNNKYVILLLCNLFLILVGMFLDIGPALLILGPILAPLAINLGVHPLHFGIMMCVNLNIALMTPPMGACLFMGMIVSGLKLGELVKALWPFILVAEGFEVIKIKIGSNAEQDVERIKAVRETVGDTIRLRVDANQGYDRATARRVLTCLEPLALEWIEQPLPDWDLEGLAELTGSFDTPLAVDESVYTAHDARRVIAMKAADVVNIKVPKCGGIYRSQQIADVCQSNGIPCFLGGCLETSPGAAAQAHFYTATPNVISAAEMEPWQYVDDIVTSPMVMKNGSVKIPQSSGLGVIIDEDKVAHYRVTF